MFFVPIKFTCSAGQHAFILIELDGVQDVLMFACGKKKPLELVTFTLLFLPQSSKFLRKYFSG